MAGKGDKPRPVEFKKFQDNHERIFAKKSWQFWLAWDGYKQSKVVFNDDGLEEGEKISYKEYWSRLKFK